MSLASAAKTAPGVRTAAGAAPARAGLVLVALIAVAGVANLNLAVANVALPSIDKAFGASQTAGIIVFWSLMGSMFIGQQFMQNVLGYSTLDAGLAILPNPAAIAASVAASPDASRVTAQTQSALQLSYASAAQMAAQYPQCADAIIGAAKTAFLDGANLAYLAGCIFITGGAVLVWFMFPSATASARSSRSTGRRKPSGPGRPDRR